MLASATYAYPATMLEWIGTPRVPDVDYGTWPQLLHLQSRWFAAAWTNRDASALQWMVGSADGNDQECLLNMSITCQTWFKIYSRGAIILDTRTALNTTFLRRFTCICIIIVGNSLCRLQFWTLPNSCWRYRRAIAALYIALFPLFQDAV